MHAGELTQGLVPLNGPGSLADSHIRQTVEIAGAERIGHGVRAVEDDSLLGYLVERGVPLEVCPTSNVRLGVYGSYAEHPLRELHAAGAVLTISTDTPAVFGITLIDELRLLETEFGLSEEAVRAVVRNGFRASFLGVDERDALAEGLDL
jgi:adenosine deaminase